MIVRPRLSLCKHYWHFINQMSPDTKRRIRRSQRTRTNKNIHNFTFTIWHIHLIEAPLLLTDHQPAWSPYTLSITAIMELFVYLKKYRIVVCKTCRFTYISNEAATHLRIRHRHKTPTERRQVAATISNFLRIIRSQAELRGLQLPPPTIDLPYFPKNRWTCMSEMWSYRPSSPGHPRTLPRIPCMVESAGGGKTIEC